MQRVAQKRGAAGSLAFLRETGKERRQESVAVGADFGWRLHGKIVRSLSDSSLQLPSRQLALAARLTEHCTSGTPLQSCLQCGACTVTRRLAGSLKEYGYGVYPNVISATELEWMLNPRGPTGGAIA